MKKVRIYIRIITRFLLLLLLLLPKHRRRVNLEVHTKFAYPCEKCVLDSCLCRGHLCHHAQY